MIASSCRMFRGAQLPAVHALQAQLAEVWHVRSAAMRRNMWRRHHSTSWIARVCQLIDGVLSIHAVQLAVGIHMLPSGCRCCYLCSA